MPVYEYKGVSSTGRSVGGVRDGENIRTVRARLKAEGIVVLDIREGGALSAARGGGRTGVFAGKVRQADLALVTRQLATLLSSGLPLLEALNALVEQEEREALKGALSAARDAVREGASLADGFRRDPRAFPPLYVNMVAAGEAGGTLEAALARLADFLEEQAQFRARLGTALFYPAAMTVVGIATLVFIFAFVMPRITGMFEDMRQQLPLVTLLLLSIVRIVSGFWWLLLLLLAAAVYAFRRYASTAEGRDRLDRLVLAAPLAGPVVSMAAASRFCRTLGTLLRSGVPMLTALDIVQNVAGNTVFAAAVRSARESVREGEPMAEPLRRSGLFPPLVVQMIAVGEKSGELEAMLLKVAETYERMIEVRIGRFMALLQPVIIIAMAVVVGFVVIAVMLPLLQMSGGLR